MRPEIKQGYFCVMISFPFKVLGFQPAVKAGQPKHLCGCVRCPSEYYAVSRSRDVICFQDVRCLNASPVNNTSSGVFILYITLG